jgi:hypothetical protein
MLVQQVLTRPVEPVKQFGPFGVHQVEHGKDNFYTC